MPKPSSGIGATSVALPGASPGTSLVGSSVQLGGVDAAVEDLAGGGAGVFVG